MAIVIPTTEPTSIISGDTVKWTKSLPDYLPTLWTLKYEIVNSAAAKTITATDNGDTHLATLTAALNDLAAGDYSIVGYVTDIATGLERYTVYTGRVSVSANLADGAADVRSHIKKVLDAIEATLEGRATQDQRRMQIAGRLIERMHMEELLMLRDRYKAEYAAEVRAEKIANGLPSGGKILTRFI
jgi:hypothetical protein